MNILKKITLLFLLAVSPFSFSQSTEKIEYGNATLDANYCLVLDNSVAVQEHYTADATDLNWVSALDAAEKCGYYSNNLVSYQADYENNKMIIHIYIDRTRDVQDIIWWNAYLKSICK